MSSTFSLHTRHSFNACLSDRIGADLGAGAVPDAGRGADGGAGGQGHEGEQVHGPEAGVGGRGRRESAPPLHAQRHRHPHQGAHCLLPQVDLARIS